MSGTLGGGTGLGGLLVLTKGFMIGGGNNRRKSGKEESES